MFKSFAKEFKQFALQGNVLDLAIGVIVGAAFGKIVTSLVNDIIMPMVGIILGGYDFKTLSYTVGKSVIMYGAFIQNIIDFVIVALVIFLSIRMINRLSKRKISKALEPKE